jgi:hypothetical protein
MFDEITFNQRHAAPEAGGDTQILEERIDCAPPSLRGGYMAELGEL